MIADNQNEAVREITFALPGQMVQVSQPDMMAIPAAATRWATQAGGFRRRQFDGRFRQQRGYRGRIGVDREGQVGQARFDEGDRAPVFRRAGCRGAQNIANYGLVTLPKSKKQKSKPVALKTASYNPTTHRVTLMTRKALVFSSPLEVTVKAAGLLDAVGDPLNGGANAVFILSKSGATMTTGS